MAYCKVLKSIAKKFNKQIKTNKNSIKKQTQYKKHAFKKDKKAQNQVKNTKTKQKIDKEFT